MSTAHVYSANILSGPCPKMKIVPPLYLELPGKEAYMPRPEGGAVEIHWQLLSPVTAPPDICFSVVVKNCDLIIEVFMFLNLLLIKL